MSRPRRLVAGLGVVLALAGVACAPGAALWRDVGVRAAKPAAAIGVTANSLDDAVGPTQDAVRRLGVGWIREELRWSEAEPVRGRLDWSRFDRVVLAAAHRRLRVLPLLIRTPRWLAVHPMTLPPSLALWSRFVRGAVARYGPRGAFWAAHPGLDGRLAMGTWEIWNEPYLRAFSYPTPSPARYASLVRATVTAGREVSPGSRFLMAAELTWTARDGEARPWIDDLFAAVPDLGRYVDAIAVHPYTRRSPDDDRGPANSRFDRFEDLRTQLAGHGAGDVPVWLTEIGWSTCTARPPCVLPATQARYLRRMFRVLGVRYASVVRGVFVYRLGDIGGAGPGDPEGGFGLNTLRGAHKPGWSVVARAAAARP